VDFFFVFVRVDSEKKCIVIIIVYGTVQFALTSCTWSEIESHLSCAIGEYLGSRCRWGRFSGSHGVGVRIMGESWRSTEVFNVYYMLDEHGDSNTRLP
jgi:hypothetical protein